MIIVEPIFGNYINLFHTNDSKLRKLVGILKLYNLLNQFHPKKHGGLVIVNVVLLN